MATRSAGTGVLVTLVTFVLATVGLLVACVMLLSELQKSRATVESQKAFQRDVASDADVRAPDAQSLSVAAKRRGTRLVPFLIELNQRMTSQLTGGTATSLDDEKFEEAMTQLGAAGGTGVKARIDKLEGELRTATRSAASLQSQVDALRGQLEAAEQAAAGNRDSPSASLEQADATLAQLQGAAEGYRNDLAALQQSVEETRRNFEQRFSDYKSERDAEVDQLKSSKATLETQLAEANRKLAQFETTPADPALLVDGNVIQVGSGDGTIFIDVGRKQRIQPGMTFEVFASADQIRASDEQGVRGKATLQVMKVGDDTSTARVVRSSPGKPVVRGDVLANAVYSPSQRFRFLVHGKFDLDGDGRTSTDEANVIRNRIREWGGILAETDRVTGDLDFVVIGSRPKRPGKPLPDADEAELNAFTEAQDACDLYEKIEREATEARIPVLNLNRFEALTGMTN